MIGKVKKMSEFISKNGWISRKNRSDFHGFLFKAMPMMKFMQKDKEESDALR